MGSATENLISELQSLTGAARRLRGKADNLQELVKIVSKDFSGKAELSVEEAKLFIRDLIENSNSILEDAQKASRILQSIFPKFLYIEKDKTAKVVPFGQLLNFYQVVNPMSSGSLRIARLKDKSQLSRFKRRNPSCFCAMYYATYAYRPKNKRIYVLRSSGSTFAKIFAELKLKHVSKEKKNSLLCITRTGERAATKYTYAWKPYTKVSDEDVEFFLSTVPDLQDIFPVKTISQAERILFADSVLVE